MNIYCTLTLYKIQEREVLPDIFCEASITQIPKSHNEITIKEKDMNLDKKFLTM